MGILGAAWNFINNGNYKEVTDEYDRGYDAADEFLDLVDHDLTDAECNAQWDAVEAHHSEEYITGYAECIQDNAQDGIFTKAVNWLFGGNQ